MVFDHDFESASNTGKSLYFLSLRVCSSLAFSRPVDRDEAVEMIISLAVFSSASHWEMISSSLHLENE